MELLKTMRGRSKRHTKGAMQEMFPPYFSPSRMVSIERLRHLFLNKILIVTNKFQTLGFKYSYFRANRWLMFGFHCYAVSLSASKISDNNKGGYFHLYPTASVQGNYCFTLPITSENFRLVITIYSVSYHYLLYKHHCFIRISATEKIRIFSHVKIRYFYM